VSTYEVSQYQNISELVTHVQETEHKYLLHGDRRNAITLPWMPYQPADFIGIAWECMPELHGRLFLDVGCGPGTKMQIASELFGLDAYGIEVDAAMADEARKHFPERGHIVTGDALHLQPDYHPLGVFDLLWLYRPFRDPESERALEERIIAEMKPGAVLAGGSWEVDVPALGWQPIVDDCLIAPDGVGRIFRGAWKKPAA
jgi:SAM-dependent methyltransferase